jgi:hypothetical protein
MTPYQLNLFVEEINKCKKDEGEEKLILTYLGAYWQRVKRMPDIKKLLKLEQPKKQMTPEEMLEQIKKLNEAFGGTISKEEVE